MSAPGDRDRLAARLGDRFTPPAAAAGDDKTQRWEDRHVRVTVWMDRDLRDRLWAAADAAGLSRRQVADEMAELWLAQRPPSTVDRRRSR